MLILALDTTTRAGSVALLGDDDLVGTVVGDASRTHAERLPGDIIRLLAAQNLELSRIDLFAVAAGPGSFTGLRIGIATIQGFAFALDRPVVGVSVLDALAVVAAAHASQEEDLVAAWMDAQRNEVFATLYRVRSEGAAVQPVYETLDGPVSEPASRILDRWVAIAPGRVIRFAGDGVPRYADVITGRLGARFKAVEPLPPLAPVVGRVARREALAGRAVTPHGVRPIYVRRPDAELTRERNEAAGQK